MDKRRNLEKGTAGETIAINYLEAHAYQILARNWRYQHFEIDIIAKKNKVLHIIEVKTRHSLAFGYPEESIGKSKMNFLKKAAAYFQYLNPSYQRVQFNVIAIIVNPNQAIELAFFEDVYF